MSDQSGDRPTLRKLEGKCDADPVSARVVVALQAFASSAEQRKQ
jgi:hypothetical protein